MMVEKNKNLCWPVRMKNSWRRTRSSKFCNFHQDRGHTTEECIHLKKELERLIQMGQAEEITDTPQPEFQKRQDREGATRGAPPVMPVEADQDNWPRGKVVSVIEGGNYGGLLKLPERDT
ncbi:hypothetical protein Salat_1880600 [Sesamum alatum]|uniref:Uncharacterized protein n=1 Tax=Sesamum alatum TaxID=300844 RepID=A0AAE1Y3C5_9LAMI|nr:hypothetical protein Salat_1880600 [Sesamum alatum]